MTKKASDTLDDANVGLGPVRKELLGLSVEDKDVSVDAIADELAGTHPQIAPHVFSFTLMCMCGYIVAKETDEIYYLRTPDSKDTVSRKNRAMLFESKTIN